MLGSSPTGAGAASEEAGELGRHGGVDPDDLGHVHDGVLAEAGHGDQVVEGVPWERDPLQFGSLQLGH